MEKYKFLLLSATPYSMVNERTGLVNEGVSINYLPTDNLAPCGDNNGIGHKPAKGSLPPALKNKISVAPAIYEFSFDVRIVANKPTLKMVDVDYVSAVKLTTFETKPPAEEHPEDSDPEYKPAETKPADKPAETKPSAGKSGK